MTGNSEGFYYRPSTTDRVLRTGVWASTALVGLVVLWGVWSAWPSEVARVNGISLPSTTVEQGDVLRYRVDYCKYVPVQARVQRSWQNDTVTLMPIAGSNLPVGCHVVSQQVRVPTELAPGRYSLRVEMTYDVSPLRSPVVVAYDVGPVEILKREER